MNSMAKDVLEEIDRLFWAVLIDFVPTKEEREEIGEEYDFFYEKLENMLKGDR